MTAAILTLTRVFRFGARDLPDPNPAMTVDEVLRHYSRQYPRMMGAKVIAPVLEGDQHIHVIREASYGAKG
ncbi:PRTRC system protein C OS=Stutzerimonas stutzeri OX=316 GN=G7024_19855 PE=4 SV=1 [Stutzerimonas stutzeri]